MLTSVKIPDNSQIRLELTNIGESSVTGFQDAALTFLPFQVDVTDVEISLGLAFKPVVTVGFDFLDVLTAETFVALNLPRLDAKLSTNAAANCGANSTASDAPYANTTTESTAGILALGPLVLVEANISISADVGIGLQVPLLPPPFNDVGVEANIFSTSFPLVTACVGAAVPIPAVSGIGGRNATNTGIGGAAPGYPINGMGTTVYVTSARATPVTSMAHITSWNVVPTTVSTPCNSTTVAPAKSIGHAMPTMIHTPIVHASVMKPLSMVTHIVKSHSIPVALLALPY
jgi:hypothetical protein